MAWMLGKDGKMVFVEPGTPVYGEIPAPLAMNIVNPQDGQALVYDGEKGEWKNGEGGSDFAPDISNPQDGQVLVYDGTAGKWVNGASGGGGSLVVNGTIDATDPSNVSVVLDKTADEIFTAFNAGQPVIAKIGPLPVFGDLIAMQMIYASYNESISSGNYIFKFYEGTTMYEFMASAGTDYPTAYPFS